MNLVGWECLRILKNGIRSQNLMYGMGRAFAFKSALSLENLYPKSTMKLFTPNFVPLEPSNKFSGYIPIEKLDITYSRSSGPGGQNVNCVNTKVDLRFNVKDAKWLTDDIKEKLLDQCKNRINKEGYLIIKSDVTRSQQLNLADAMERLRTMIRTALQPPPEVTEETKEVVRKRQLKAARERLHVKRIHSEIKRTRQGPNPADLD